MTPSLTISHPHNTTPDTKTDESFEPLTRLEIAKTTVLFTVAVPLGLFLYTCLTPLSILANCLLLVLPVALLAGGVYYLTAGASLLGSGLLVAGMWTSGVLMFFGDDIDAFLSPPFFAPK